MVLPWRMRMRLVESSLNFGFHLKFIVNIIHSKINENVCDENFKTVGSISWACIHPAPKKCSQPEKEGNEAAKRTEQMGVDQEHHWNWMKTAFLKVCYTFVIATVKPAKHIQCISQHNVCLDVFCLNIISFFVCLQPNGKNLFVLLQYTLFSHSGKFN